MKIQMKDNAKKYLFLGLPKSGKTTYFSLMANHLQQLANKKENKLYFKYLPTMIPDNSQDGAEGNIFKTEDLASDFIDDCMNRLSNQRWPKKTVYKSSKGNSYSFELGKRYWFFKYGIRIGWNRFIIDYHDYSGEAFDVAFGRADGMDAITQAIMDEANDMKERIMTADGIFLILDSNELFNGVETSKYGKIIVNLLRYIQEKAKTNIKLAVIFNKLELFDGVKINFKSRVRKQYGNAYAYLGSLNYRFFDVYPLGKIVTNEDGGIVPPPKIIPRNILDPVRWMIEF